MQDKGKNQDKGKVGEMGKPSLQSKFEAAMQKQYMSRPENKKRKIASLALTLRELWKLSRREGLLKPRWVVKIIARTLRTLCRKLT